MATPSETAGDADQADRRPLLLCGFSLLSYGLFYVVSVMLARLLTIPDFDDYNVAVSSLLILSALSPLGLEKFALRCLPQFKNQRQWSHSIGYWRFSLAAIGGVSVGLAILFGVTLESTLALNNASLHVPIVIAVGALPVASTCLFLLEVASAYGDPFRSAAVYRILFPLLLLLFNGLAWVATSNYSGFTAACCYCASWVVCTLAMYRLAKRSSPAPMWSAPPEYDRANWLRQSTPLLVNSLLLTILTQSGVIILELMRPSEPIVSIYAISLQTGSFVVLLATSTNRFYLPQVAILLGEAEYSQIRDAAKARFRLIAPLCGVFLIIILLWGSEILSLFGPEFASGYAALCVVSVGATVSTLFGVSPYYLQFAEHSVAVTLCTLVATGASVAACFPLVEKHGELGAAIAYAVPLAVLYLVLALAARIHQLRRRE